MICIVLCTVLMFSSTGIKALGENNQTEAENRLVNNASTNEQTQINQLTIDDFFSNLREYYHRANYTNFPFKDYVYGYLVTNYSYCNAELIYELIEKKYIDYVNIDSPHVLRDILNHVDPGMIYDTCDGKHDDIVLSSFLLNPDDRTFFSYIIEDLRIFENGIEDKYTIDKEALKRFISKYEKAYQETPVENINKWFILCYIGAYAQSNVIGFLFHEGNFRSNGSKKISGYKSEKLDEYIDYKKSSSDRLVLREGVVLDYNSDNEYIAYLGALNTVNQVLDDFNTKIIIPYENKLKDELQSISASKDKSFSDEHIISTGDIFYGASFKQIPADGFLVPVPKSYFWDVNLHDYHGGYVYSALGESLKTWLNPVYMNAYCSESMFAENPDVARAEIEKELNQIANSYENVQKKVLDVDGHPVGIIKYTIDDDRGDFGCIIYIRNNRHLTINIGSRFLWYSAPNKIYMSDLEAIVNNLSYDESQAPFTIAKAAFTISTKNSIDTVSAGKSLQMIAVFDNPDIINKKAKNDSITWTILNAETGDTTPAATINTNGQLRIDKNLDMPVQLLIKATSTVYGTEASSVITAIPVVSKVILEPAQLFFYVGTDNPQTVKASLEPATVPPVGLTWTPAKKDIVEITPMEDGMVSIKPLKTGKTDIAIKEPGGKNAKLTVNVVAPVESVELKVNGKPKVGGKVSIAAALQPKNAGNKAVQWSLDVEADIATINEKGQLTIGKEVASGTKITVTCTALGAPVPIIGTTVIEVP